MIELKVSAINALEVCYDAVKISGNAKIVSEVISAIENIPCRIEGTMNPEVLLIAAKLKAMHKISLADSIALALSKSQDIPLATSDHHEFNPLEKSGDGSFIWIR